MWNTEKLIWKLVLVISALALAVYLQRTYLKKESSAPVNQAQKESIQHESVKQIPTAQKPAQSPNPKQVVPPQNRVTPAEKEISKTTPPNQTIPIIKLKKSIDTTEPSKEQSPKPISIPVTRVTENAIVKPEEQRSSKNTDQPTTGPEKTDASIPNSDFVFYQIQARFANAESSYFNYLKHRFFKNSEYELAILGKANFYTDPSLYDGTKFSKNLFLAGIAAKALLSDTVWLNAQIEKTLGQTHATSPISLALNYQDTRHLAVIGYRFNQIWDDPVDAVSNGGAMDELHANATLTLKPNLTWDTGLSKQQLKLIDISKVANRDVIQTGFNWTLSPQKNARRNKKTILSLRYYQHQTQNSANLLPQVQLTNQVQALTLGATNTLEIAPKTTAQFSSRIGQNFSNSQWLYGIEADVRRRFRPNLDVFIHTSVANRTRTFDNPGTEVRVEAGVNLTDL